jgi:hypothetical protein
VSLVGILIFAFIVGLFELAFIYSASPKKIEVKFINNLSIVTIYESYFFLPFTTKITKYKNLQKAYVKERIEKIKGKSYEVYDLFLEFPQGSKAIIKQKSNKDEVLKYCEQINQAITSFEDCFVSEYSAVSKKSAVLILMIFTPLVFFIPPKYSNKSYLEDITQHFYILIATSGLLFVFVILSLIVNLLIKIFNIRKQPLITDYNTKKDIDTEAKKINDSLIK